MSKYKICFNGVSKHMLKRVIKPFIFGVLFSLAVLISLHFFEKNYSPLAISLIVLGTMGSLYLLIFYWLGSREIFYNKVKMKVIDICIVETNSVDYGDKIYYPLIEYEYHVDNHKYISNSICLDDRSCYVTVWYENKEENRGLLFAQQKIDKILSLDIVYSLKLFPSISYLDITFVSKRKIFFLVMQIVSITLIIFGLVLV